MRSVLSPRRYPDASGLNSLHELKKSLLDLKQNER